MKIPKKYLVIGGVLIAGLIGAGVVRIGRVSAVSVPDPKTANQKAMNEYLASDTFGKLADDKKIAFLDKVRQERPFTPGPPEGLTAQQQEKLRENVGSVFRRRMDRQMDEFFKLPPEKKKAYLDQMIDRREAMGKGRGKGPGDPPGPPPPGMGPPPGGRGRGVGPPPAVMIRRMIESTDPAQRARMVQFMEAMRQRMKERGIQNPGPPGPR